MFGRRRVFIIGAVVFTGASAAGGLAPGLAPAFAVLLACRFLQGAGGALMLPNTIAIVSAALLPGRRHCRIRVAEIVRVTKITMHFLNQRIAEFTVTDPGLVIEPAALAAARQSLDSSGLLLLGEVHGVRENPVLIRAFMQALELTSLALEWPGDFTPVIRAFLASGTLADHW